MRRTPQSRLYAGASDVAKQASKPRVELKSETEIESIRAAGALVAAAIEAARAACVVGATTQEINRAAHEVITQGGGEAIFLGYARAPEVPQGTHFTPRPAFPAATCISVNEVLVHGVPGNRVICSGDLVSIDAGASLNGWCADSAVTVCVGDVHSDARAMLACAERMLSTAIASARPGVRWSSIAHDVERIATDAGFAIAVDFVGHGIGRALHEAPQVPSNNSKQFVECHDFTLRPGMVLAVEPMLILETPTRHTEAPKCGELRNPPCTLSSDGWTVIVDSGAPSCHVEHTIAITRDGADILTLLRAA